MLDDCIPSGFITTLDLLIYYLYWYSLNPKRVDS